MRPSTWDASTFPWLCRGLWPTLGGRGRMLEQLNLKPRSETVCLIEDIENLVSRFYIKLMVKDRPGGLASYSKILGENNISISGVLQHEGCGPDNSVPIVIATHPTCKRDITKALKEIVQLDSISGDAVCIRIVDIPEDMD